MLALFAQSIRKNEETSLRTTGVYFLMLLGIFLSNGFFLLGNRLKHELFGEANTAALTFIVFLVGGLIAWFVTVLGKQRNQIGLNEWKAGGLTGLSNSIGTIFYLSAMSLPATVVFPLNASIALLGGVVLTTAIYGEKFDHYKTAAMGVGTVALLLAIFREQIV
jgi:drug/metabolite transporter (DMT)-like permease